MSTPILSIITPVLNGERYLKEFIQAVIDQNCSKIEHIFVDGCSQDRSLTIIKEFASRYPHIRYLSEKDCGSADAINKGIALAQGEFMTILCLNDFYEPNTLNEVVELLPGLPQPAFLVGNCNVLNEKDELKYVNKPEALSVVKIMMRRAFPYNPSAYFYRKDLHQKAGLYQDGDSFDLDFLIRVFRFAKVRYIDKTWGNFRLMPGSITVKAGREGRLKAGEDAIRARYLKTYPFYLRVFIKTAVTLDKVPKLAYFLERIVHYLRNPNDIARVFNKKLFTGLLSLFLFSLTVSSLADTVTLKSGEVLEGKAVMTSATAVWFQDAAGKIKEYPLTDVEKIEKSPAKPVKTLPSSSADIQKNSAPVQKIPPAAQAKKNAEQPQYLDHELFLIYVPTGVVANKKYPLVVALSPGGDAQSMVNAWMGVAEEFKWIIVASKEFRNGVDMTPILGRIAAHLPMIVNDFPVDRTRIIATGFSGGAMGSHLMAYTYPDMVAAVVINTGMIHESFLSQKNRYPRSKAAVFLASPGDFRYDEMKRDRIFLEGLGWKTQWIEFPGGHTLAPQSAYREAARWFRDQLNYRN